MKMVIGDSRFHIDAPARNAANLNRADILVRKTSQAMASLCKSDAYLMVLRRNGDGGGVGITQTPWVPSNMPSQYRKDNVWEDYDFPSLQLNDRVSKYTVST